MHKHMILYIGLFFLNTNEMSSIPCAFLRRTVVTTLTDAGECGGQIKLRWQDSPLGPLAQSTLQCCGSSGNKLRAFGIRCDSIVVVFLAWHVCASIGCTSFINECKPSARALSVLSALTRYLSRKCFNYSETHDPFTVFFFCIRTNYYHRFTGTRSPIRNRCHRSWRWRRHWVKIIKKSLLLRLSKIKHIFVFVWIKTSKRKCLCLQKSKIYLFSIVFPAFGLILY